MDLTSLKTIKEICDTNGIRLSKKRGQNFLIDRKVLDKIIQFSGLSQQDIVLEIGGGFGVLTLELAKNVKKVIVVEADRKAVGILRQNLRNFKNVEIVEGDILELTTSNLKLTTLPYKIVANIPYQITSRLIRQFLEEKNQPQEMVLMVQKEVAQRIMANDGKESLLSISVKFYAKPEILFYVSKNSFWPRPKVDSAIIKIGGIGVKREIGEKEMFFRVVRAGFAKKRGQLAGNLAKGIKISKERVNILLEKAKIDQKARAEDLKVEDWLRLVNIFNKIQ